MKVRIYKPAKSAMQSGKANSKKWLVEPIEETNSHSLDKIMNWVSTSDVKLSELHFYFNSKDEAVDFAKKSNFKFVIEEPKIAKLQKKSYADNFTN